MKIVDCFIFYNELEMLTYRLAILNDAVDYFVIVESNHTFIGKGKSSIFNEQRHLFEQYMHKIIHVIVDMPYVHPNINIANNEQWQNEYYQRNSIKRGLDRLTLAEEDIILVSDVDEIPDLTILNHIKKNDIPITIYCFIQDMYYYNLTSRLDQKWSLAKILSYKTYTELSLSLNDVRNYNCPGILRGGWHLSYFGDTRFIQNKIQNFSHQELNTDSFVDLEKIESRMQSRSDLYDRKGNGITKIAIKDNQYLPPQYEEYLRNFI